MPISKPQSVDLQAYSFADWETASKNENLIRKKVIGTNGDQPSFTQSKFLVSCGNTHRLFYEELTKNLDGSLKHLESLESFLDKTCGKQSPSLLNFRGALENILRLVKKTINPTVGVDPQLEIPESKQESRLSELKDNVMTTSDLPQRTSIKSRAQAYKMLREAADYLLQAEPHSPTPYLVRRAVSWGNMTLAELLREIVKDQNDIHMIYELLGITEISDKQHEHEN